MTNIPLHADWNSTDDAAERSVHASKIVAEPSQQREVLVDGMQSEAPVRMPNARSMQLAALTGVGIVLIVAAFGFGVLNIRGDLASSDPPPVSDIVMTTEGRFEPTTINVAAGARLLIENKYATAQAIKFKTQRSLFMPQVLFSGESYTALIPSDARGAYVLYAEGLPDTEIVTINVTQPMELGTDAATPIPFGTSSSSDRTPIPFGETIDNRDTPIPFGTSSSSSRSTPIPFGDVQPSSSAIASSQSSISSSPAQTNSSSPSASTTAPIDVPNTGALGGGGSPVFSIPRTEAERSLPVFTTNALPINPFTVVQSEKEEKRSALLAKQAKNKQQLHSGAPLAALRSHPPQKTAETGPAGIATIFIIAFVGVAVMYRYSERAMSVR